MLTAQFSWLHKTQSELTVAAADLELEISNLYSLSAPLEESSVRLMLCLFATEQCPESLEHLSLMYSLKKRSCNVCFCSTTTRRHVWCALIRAKGLSDPPDVN